jgi:hypothetical protein
MPFGMVFIALCHKLSPAIELVVFGAKMSKTREEFIPICRWGVNV